MDDGRFCFLYLLRIKLTKMSYQNTQGWHNNNPANLRGENVEWLGKTGMSQTGFSVFSERKYGVRAVYRDILAKIKAGENTIEKIISKFAPPTENKTGDYILYVAKHTGLPANLPLGADVINARKIVKAIISKEIGYNIPDSELVEAEKLLSEKKKR